MIDNLLEENRIIVNKALEIAIPREMGQFTQALSEPIWDFLDRGGKRWRPLLAKLCCEALGGQSAAYGQILIIPELIHNGSLIVDDIEDGSELRRGKPCLHLIFGMDIALNAGNFLYFAPFKIVKESGFPDKQQLYELIGTESLSLHNGQAMDILWHKTQIIPSEAEYFKMCANKTGSMARLAAKLGAALAGANEKQQASLGKFAESIGIAFQIQDDILNIEQSLGKEYGEDITEGKKSLPVIIAFSSANPAEKEMLSEILGLHTREKAMIDEAIAMLRKYDAIRIARDKADKLVASALKAISFLPENKAKEHLEEIALFMARRNH
jgi:geranylgeranyl pyrophosphate synthase